MLIFSSLRLLLLLQCARCMSAAQPQNDSGGSSSSSDTGATDNSPTVSTILFVGVGAFFFSGLLLVALRRHLAACFGINLNGGGGGGVGSRGPQGLSREVIDAFPTYLYEEVNKLHGLMDRELECAICLNEFEPHQALRLLPECSHIFHPQCIDPWLLSQATCPVCRSTIPEPSGSTSDASEDDHNHLIIMDQIPSVKTPIHQDLEHGSPSQSENLTTTTVEIGTTQVVPAVLAKSHSTGHAISFMARRCELARPLYSRDRASLSEGARIPWCSRMEFNRSGGDQESLDLGSLNQNPIGFVSQTGSPLSDSGVCYA